jgi:hypothetical protein
MHRHHIVSGLLLILPIINFALGAPALAPVKQELEAGAVEVHIPEDAVTVLKRRGRDSIERLFANLKISLDPRPSSSSSSSRPSGPAPAHAQQPNSAGPSTESDYESTKVDAPLSTTVFPTWFHPVHADYGMMGAHPSLPKLGPPGPALKESDSGQKLVVEEPPSPRKGSSTGSGSGLELEMVPGPAHATKPNVIDRSRT